MKKMVMIGLALILSCLLTVPAFAASRADNRQIGYTTQVLQKGKDKSTVQDENLDIEAPLPLGVAISYSNLNGAQANAGVGSRSARNRAMNDSMGKADLYAILNPLHVGVAAAVRI